MVSQSEATRSKNACTSLAFMVAVYFCATPRGREGIEFALVGRYSPSCREGGFPASGFPAYRVLGNSDGIKRGPGCITPASRGVSYYLEKRRIRKRPMKYRAPPARARVTQPPPVLGSALATGAG